MSLMISTNVMAINAQHLLAANSSKYSKALERLSSGLRINRAADDAAGLAQRARRHQHDSDR
jgi:flagellin